MLEKIRLPARPSLRGNHCQGCSSQFTFINRKHHCRRCGGLFCGNCTRQRMVLRGQSDSFVRICDPCRKLEEAARFETRHGHKNRSGRGSSRMTAKNEDEILNEILGNDRMESSSSGQQSNTDMFSSIQRATSRASYSNTQQVDALDGDVAESIVHKRVGNVAESIVHLKKAKLLERDLESLGGEVGSSIVHETTRMTKSSPSQNTIAKSNVSSKPARRSRLMIQKELLAIKKKALALRREGRLNAAEEELKKGKVLEQQLEEMDNASNVKGKQASVGSENPDLENEDPTVTGSPPIREGGEDVTEQDMHDPAYLSLLRSLGWKDDDNEHAISPFNPQESDNLSTQTNNPLVTQSTSNISWRTPRRSKAEIQRAFRAEKKGSYFKTRR